LRSIARSSAVATKRHPPAAEASRLDASCLDASCLDASCLYEGFVVHRRDMPARAFRHRITMAYIDLDELPRLMGGRLVRRSPGVLRFRRADYHGPADVPLGESVRESVWRQTGRRPEGPIRLLTNLRSFGHCFNPVSFYYCFDQSSRLEAILAEVTNTPWGERHAYAVLGGTGRFEKAMHVSPFMEMDLVYQLSASIPGPSLRVVIENHRGSARIFEAALTLRRRDLNAASLRRLALRYPLAGVRVLALIYGHAIGLRLAGVSAFGHPERTAS
jgi:DUF1365 family protein